MKNLIHKSVENEYEWTTNRKLYNQHRKRRLEHDKIKCARCPYNRVENWKGKHYGGTVLEGDESDITYPSWKLSTKNRKQWERKTYKIFKTESRMRGFVHVDIRWKSKKYVR